MEDTVESSPGSDSPLRLIMHYCVGCGLPIEGDCLSLCLYCASGETQPIRCHKAANMCVHCYRVRKRCNCGTPIEHCLYGLVKDCQNCRAFTLRRGTVLLRRKIASAELMWTLPQDIFNIVVEILDHHESLDQVVKEVDQHLRRTQLKFFANTLYGGTGFIDVEPTNESKIPAVLPYLSGLIGTEGPCDVPYALSADDTGVPDSASVSDNAEDVCSCCGAAENLMLCVTLGAMLCEACAREV